MSQPTSLSAWRRASRQVYVLFYKTSLSAECRASRQTCWLAHEDFCLKNWAIVLESIQRFNWTTVRMHACSQMGSRHGSKTKSALTVPPPFCKTRKWMKRCVSVSYSCYSKTLPTRGVQRGI
jgi:hypothetical protein